jgi:hypothetical protein
VLNDLLGKPISRQIDNIKNAVHQKVVDQLRLARRVRCFASLALRVSILIDDDLPTFDLPIKAYSALSGLGHPSTLGLLIT